MTVKLTVAQVIEAFTEFPLLITGTDSTAASSLSTDTRSPGFADVRRLMGSAAPLGCDLNV